MIRIRAAALYFAATLAVASLAFLPIYFLWYPGALFAHAGGRELFTLLVSVDLVLGPLIVLIIYKPGKRGLKLDLALLAAVQLCALGYGIYVLLESRPVYIVFVKDRFELVRANDIPDKELEKARGGPYAAEPLLGPRVVAAQMPKDPNEQFRIAMSAMSGVDIQYFPQHYVSYEDTKGEVMLKAAPMAKLRALNPQRGAEIDAMEKQLGKSDADLRFLPMRAGNRDLTVVLDNARADVLEIAPFRPWEYN